MTNRKSHMRFRLVLKSMTLDDLGHVRVCLFFDDKKQITVTRIFQSLTVAFQ